jgi:hypothetical protein
MGDKCPSTGEIALKAARISSRSTLPIGAAIRPSREAAPLRASVSRARALHPFRIDARVVMRDHLHPVWTLPEVDADFPTR